LETAPVAAVPDILIVDDDGDCLAEYSSLFDTAGFRPLTAQSAAEGLRVLSANPSVYVVLTDIGMPGVDGMTFLKLVRSMFKEQPPPQAIIVTGQGSMALVVEAMRGDAVDFLSKPATGSELLSAVARAEERWRASTGSRGQNIHSKPRGYPTSFYRQADFCREREMLELQLFARQARAKFFNPELVFDSSWHMLLQLALARWSQRAVCVASLVGNSGTAATTALRWLSTLEQHKLVVRERDKQDRRRILVRLNDDALKAMLAYLHHVDTAQPQPGSPFSAAA
jgi:CheY-like chemotaxis protein